MTKEKKTKKEEKKVEPVVEKHHMKRWEIYSLIVLVAFVIGAGIYGAYYYVENIANTPATVTEEVNVTRTEEEINLDEVKKDLENDASLDMTDIDNELKELDSIDLSGV